MKGRKNALGYKHTASTIKKLSLISSNVKHNVDSLLKMREAWAERKNNNKPLQSDILALHSQDSSVKKKAPHSKKVIVKNIEDNSIKIFNSLTDAAKYLNLNRSTLRNYINSKNVFIMVRAGSDNNKPVKEKFNISWG